MCLGARRPSPPTIIRAHQTHGRGGPSGEIAVLLAGSVPQIAARQHALAPRVGQVIAYTLFDLPKFRCRFFFSPEGAGGGLSAWFSLGRPFLHGSPLSGWSWGSTARGAAALTQGSVDTCVGVGFGLSRLVTLTTFASMALVARGAGLLLGALPSCSACYGYVVFYACVFSPAWPLSPEELGSYSGRSLHARVLWLRCM
jgi:hypothetical protein